MEQIHIFSYALFGFIVTVKHQRMVMEYLIVSFSTQFTLIPFLYLYTEQVNVFYITDFHKQNSVSKRSIQHYGTYNRVYITLFMFLFGSGEVTK
jgi:hypothetical protein